MSVYTLQVYNHRIQLSNQNHHHHRNVVITLIQWTEVGIPPALEAGTGQEERIQLTARQFQPTGCGSRDVLIVVKKVKDECCYFIVVKLQYFHM
ncbi:hypothetical protein XENOCAPTIV_010506 [Xenoophorus captivus]|uniref:Uncharacterized protein n=1 Tax=Xenoophorus captivus TaxID=1517983 RepID=A0ABV0RGN6_9TELE